MLHQRPRQHLWLRTALDLWASDTTYNVGMFILCCLIAALLICWVHP